MRNSLALNYLPQKFTRPISIHSEVFGSETPSCDPSASSSAGKPISVAGETSNEGVKKRRSTLPRLTKGPEPDVSNGEGGMRRRAPKRGGGREAFRVHEARMPDEGDEDYDGVDLDSSKGDQGTWWRIWGSGMRWNRFKWTLFATNMLVRAFLILCSRF